MTGGDGGGSAKQGDGTEGKECIELDRGKYGGGEMYKRRSSWKNQFRFGALRKIRLYLGHATSTLPTLNGGPQCQI